MKSTAPLNSVSMDLKTRVKSPLSRPLPGNAPYQSEHRFQARKMPYQMTAYLWRRRMQRAICSVFVPFATTFASYPPTRISPRDSYPGLREWYKSWVPNPTWPRLVRQCHSLATPICLTDPPSRARALPFIKSCSDLWPGPLRTQLQSRPWKPSLSQCYWGSIRFVRVVTIHLDGLLAQ